MSTKCFIKYFFIAIIVQVVILGLCWYAPSLGRLLFTYIYEPWVDLAITLSGRKGEAAMIMPPVIGLIGGVILYSLIAGIVICYFKGRRRIT